MLHYPPPAAWKRAIRFEGLWRTMTTVWLCIGVAVTAFAFGVAGLYLQKLLPEPHTSDRSRDMIGAIVGLISLLLALVLGTLVGSAYSFYATQKSEIETF